MIKGNIFIKVELVRVYTLIVLQIPNINRSINYNHFGHLWNIVTNQPKGYSTGTFSTEKQHIHMKSKGQVNSGSGKWTSSNRVQHVGGNKEGKRQKVFKGTSFSHLIHIFIICPRWLVQVQCQHWQVKALCMRWKVVFLAPALHWNDLWG